MTQVVNVLISGANRGLGKGLVQRFLLKPNHTVIAANRRTDEASSQPLRDFPVGTGSRLIIVRCDASVNTDPARAVEELQAQGVDHLDIVVANAGIAQGYPLVKDLDLADLQSHLIPNVFGVIALYQATRALLLQGTQPRWFTMGSSAGWFE
jgi:NAD(P)-dependent dehydrogenase (short-subunit alcohol dehydrogenase family)